MAKDTKTKEKNQEVKHKAFTMKTRNEKGVMVDFKVVAPEDSLDEDGHAEEALTGVYRFA